MKLFLSSIRLPNHDEQAKLFKNKSSVSVAIIPNAWDVYPEERQKLELDSTVSLFKDLGFTTSVIDLTTSHSYRKNQFELYDFIWVMGGNTFYLNYKLHKTGNVRILKNAINNGVVYGGTSAGSVIAGTTLHGVENVDDINDAPEAIWDGLGLVDFSIVPHWGMEEHASDFEKVKQGMADYSDTIYTITNDEALTYIDGKIEVH
jgi:dipeptidase E